MYQYYPGQFAQYPQTNSLIRVTGMDGAKAYQMQPNSTAALFDASEDIMYIKSTDGAGFPTIRTFKFDELRPTQMSVTNDYVSRQEFEDFKKEILSYGKQLISKSETNEQHTETNGNAKGKKPERSVL